MARYIQNKYRIDHRTGYGDGLVVLSDNFDVKRIDPFSIALCTIRIARRLGILPTSSIQSIQLAYDQEHDNLLFPAPIASWIANTRIRYLRGWKRYESCVKGFNGLGLIADLVLKELKQFHNMTPSELSQLAIQFLISRKQDGIPEATQVFNMQEVEELVSTDLNQISDIDLAIWKVCSKRTIVCSTSSNMGISLHQILRDMQRTRINVGGREVRLLNGNEGHLIIWCPDEEADFMNPEKTDALRKIEAELPSLTKLRTYINRKQRDPGALADALKLGGYFFPTNPQSREELQNLLANAFKSMAAEYKCNQADLLKIDNVQQVLHTLGCTIENGKVEVHEGVESGLYGLMAAYLLMLDEALQEPELLAISTWNQASIGAALAAAVLADEGIRDWERLSPSVRNQIAEILPYLSNWMNTNRLGVDLKTRIHGVFDIANLQSLAQLLGVVVEQHSSGRGVAYVGLGSSSYANGNSCYNILKNSEKHGGPFHGKNTFHPATHTLNPIAQAIVVADDLLRAVQKLGNASSAEVSQYVRKPEPAGAAALAGYLLTRLDDSTLSIEEIVYALRMAGFTKQLFLEFAGYSNDCEGANWFVQEASEEGELMQAFAESLLYYLDLDINELATIVEKERTRSKEEFLKKPIDPPDFEALNPAVHIYLTGDNTRQPCLAWYSSLITNMVGNLASLQTLIINSDEELRNKCSKKLEMHSSKLTSYLDLFGYLEQVFQFNANRTFIIDSCNDRDWTFSQIFDVSRSIAGGLLSRKLKRGDRVAVLLPNSVPFVATYLACMMSGLVIVPINPIFTPKEITTILNLSNCKLIIYAEATKRHIQQINHHLDVSLLKFISANNIGYDCNDSEFLDCLDIDSREHIEWGIPFSECHLDDPFLVLFTSGTTALPKGVVHSAKSIIGNAITFNAVMNFDMESRFLHIWPMAYSSGILNTIFSPLMATSSIVISEPFDARSALHFWETVIRHKVNTLWMSPTMLSSLLEIDRDARGPAYCKEFIRTICCGTAALPRTVKQRFEQKYSIEVFESYGLTELLLVAVNSPRYPRRNGAVGCALPGVDIRIGRKDSANDYEDEDMDIGGEILVKTPYSMLGYINNDTGDITSLSEGTYFPTGDIGRLDADGNLFITGRKKELIVRGGQTISPATVREVLLSVPGVADAYVVGVPDTFYGEQVGVAVKLDEGFNFNEVKVSIFEYCRRELNPVAIPTIIAEIDSFPLGSTGKVLGQEIRRFLTIQSKRSSME